MNSLREMLAMMELELRRLRHDRTEIYTRAIQPILWLVIYGTIMSAIRAIQTGGISYLAFITPGILLQSTVFVSVFYGLTMVWERDTGILKKLLVAPVPRYSTVIGKTIASGIRAIFQAFVIIPVALLLGVRVIAQPFFLLGGIGVLFLVSGGFAAVSILVASFMKTRERFMGIGQAIIMPLFFSSSALYPIKMMPPWLQKAALLNPMTYAVDAVRGLTVSGDLARLRVDVVSILIFDVLMFLAASISFRKIIE
jgi:ABC-2 type transport system permease protein